MQTKQPADPSKIIVEELNSFINKVDLVETEYKKGNLNGELVTHLDNLYETLKSDKGELKNSKETRVNYWKALALLAELYAYFGAFKKAEELAKNGEESYKLLSNIDSILDSIRQRQLTPKESEEECKLLREQIRLCCIYAHVCFLWKNKYKDAKDILTECIGLLEKVSIANPEVPCHATLAHLSFYLGRTCRRLYEYDNAERHFANCLNNYSLKAEFTIKHRSKINKEKFNQTLAFIQYKSALCQALGFGTLKYSRGHIMTALSYIAPAQIMLADKKDELNMAYVNLIHGSILTTLYDYESDKESDKKEFNKGMEKLKASYDTFNTTNAIKNFRYIARSAYEIGRACFHKGDLVEAFEKLTEIKDIAERNDDKHWICKSKTLLCRIECKRNNFHRAEEIATEAIKLAETYNQKPSKIYALMARGEARIALGEYAAARNDLEEAIKINSTPEPDSKITSRNIEAVCKLFVARSYTREDKGYKANNYLESARAIQPKIEHVAVRKIFNEVTKEVKDATDNYFVISAFEKNLEYKYHDNRLKQFLIGRARYKLFSDKEKIADKEKITDKEKIAEELGISRQTLYDWEKDRKSRSSSKSPKKNSKSKKRSKN